MNKLDRHFLAGEVLEHSNDAVFVFDPGHDRIVEANVRACQLLGYSHDEVLTIPMSTILPKEMPKLVNLARATPHSERGLIDEAICLTKGGEIVRSEISAAPIDLGDDTGITASIREITQRKFAQDGLVYRAFHDPLTGLANRQLFLDRLTIALARSQRRPARVAVFFLDLDRFKLVNDSYGHDVGDEVLKALGGRIRKALRPSDTAARFGGDEFAILSEDIESEADAIAIAERVLEATSVPSLAIDDEIALTVSIGIALSSEGNDQPDVMLRNADAAMYRAKERGKARYELFDEGMRTRARARLRSETSLRQALEREEFRIFYQPEIDLRTGGITTVEALVRWNHPQRGLLEPSDFLALAEETKLIIPIGSWVLEEACLQAQRWRTVNQHRRSLALAVNLSARQLGQSDLVDVVARVLTDTGTAPSTLCLEITESAVLEDVDASVNILLALKGLGVHLAMDDLGKGYTSLSFLKRLPVDTVKIDRSFVQGLDGDPADLAIVKAIITMARALDLTVIAEGIETVEQRDLLCSLDCELGQGFYFAHPQSDEAVGETLMAGAAHG
jgi:diguanylate cyclase (GGDEF)-like protein/PAS domain S-box-containing protein